MAGEDRGGAEVSESIHQQQLIYVAGPMKTGPDKPWWRKRQDFADAAIAIMMQRGHHPILPIATATVDERAYTLGIEISKDRWLELDTEIIDRCDGMYVVEESDGVRTEIEFCEDNDIPVYEEISEIPIYTPVEPEVPADD